MEIFNYFIFGGDRNKFPFNDLFLFDIKMEIGEQQENKNDKTSIKCKKRRRK